MTHKAQIKKHKSHLHTAMLLTFELMFNFSMLFILFPLFDWFMKKIIRQWGSSYITLNNLLSFITYLPTMVLLLATLLILCLCNTIKVTALTQLSFYPPPIELKDMILAYYYALKSSLKSLVRRSDAIPFAFIYFFQLNLPIILGITFYISIPTALRIGKNDAVFLKGLIMVGAIVLYLLSFSSLFLFHCGYRKSQTAKKSKEDSKYLLQNKMLHTLWSLLKSNFVLVILLHIIYYTVLVITAILVYIFADKRMVITVFLSLYPKINICTFLFLGNISFVVNFKLVTKLYQQSVERAEYQDLYKEKSIRMPNVPHPTFVRYPKIFVSVIILLFAFGLNYFSQSIKNSSFQLQNSLARTSIASHRGNSSLAPENTLPALEYAIKSQSEYAEIDVQQSKDGALIIMHDRTVDRTTNYSGDIGTFTLDELKAMDAGSWFNEEYAYTPIPTLEEVFALCKGKIKLNIHVKSYRQDYDLVVNLVQLIDAYDLEEECIISSTNYNLLKLIQQKNKNLKVGLIFSSFYTNYIKNDFIDFYSVRSAYITKSMIDSAHQKGKEIHAWTVNTSQEIERLKSLGIDCIITDDPMLTREVLYEDDTTKPFIYLFKRMLKHRSFYDITKASSLNLKLLPDKISWELY